MGDILARTGFHTVQSTAKFQLRQPSAVSQSVAGAHQQTDWVLEGQIDETEAVRSVRVHPLPFGVGRRDDLSLRLTCPTVSKLHAEFVQRGGSLFVRDLGSTNGTFVNGNRVQGEVPVNSTDLLQFGRVVLRLNRREIASRALTACEDVYDRAFALTQFDKLMGDGAVTPHYQPIVLMGTRRVAAYEVLGRSRLFGLRNPREMFMAASQLNCEVELSRMLCREGVQIATTLQDSPHVFLNTHPHELHDLPALLSLLADMRTFADQQRLTLEIHECAATDSSKMIELRAGLDDLDIGLAYDDFGTGQSRFAELADVAPDYLKFDIGLIRGIHCASAERQNMLATLVRMTLDLGVAPLAEGVESAEDDQTCRQMGFEFGQGYHYGRPAPPHQLRMTDA